MVIDKQKMTAEISVYEINERMQVLNLIDQNRKNKLTYAATQLGDEITAKTKAYSKEEQKLTIEYAAKKEDGDFKLDAKGGFLIDSKRLVEYMAKKEELSTSTIVTLDLYYCKDDKLISELPITFIKKLNGLLFDYDLSAYETNQKDPEIIITTNGEYKA